MSERTPTVSPQLAADSLNLHVWELRAMLHRAAADEFKRIADTVYAGYPVPEDRIERARRLQEAAIACPDEDLEASSVASSSADRKETK